MSARRCMTATAAAALAGSVAACELRELTITQPDRAVIAEAYVRIGVRQLLGGPPGTEDQPFTMVSVFLHETLDASGSSAEVPGARVRDTRPADGLALTLSEERGGTAICVGVVAETGKGTCYATAADQAGVSTLAPGDRLGLRIELADGRVLTSDTVVPGSFALLNVRDGSTCAVVPFTGSGIEWSRSAGAWAYISDTFISGLARIFDPDDVTDPLYIWGLSVSAQDTAIVFPREFGVFARGELDRDVAITLQRGLPDSTSALVTVSAVDRNWVNWARGGNFNPSGQVRVPSVRGDGTGVFGSAVVRSFRVVSQSPTSGLAACPPDVVEPPGD